jgi:hypothetical protein
LLPGAVDGAFDLCDFDFCHDAQAVCKLKRIGLRAKV